MDTPSTRKMELIAMPESGKDPWVVLKSTPDLMQKLTACEILSGCLPSDSTVSHASQPAVVLEFLLGQKFAQLHLDAQGSVTDLKVVARLLEVVVLLLKSAVSDSPPDEYGIVLCANRRYPVTHLNYTNFLDQVLKLVASAISPLDGPSPILGERIEGLCNAIQDASLRSIELAEKMVR